MAAPFVQLSLHGAVVSGDPAALQAAFAAQHFIRLPGLLDGGLLQQVQARVDSSGWHRRDHTGVGAELEPDDRALNTILRMAVAVPEFFGLVERVTGCEPITHFKGRVFRMAAEPGIADGWHDDLVGGRMAAMSINLGREPYAGGSLLLRDVATGTILAEVANTVPGDAVLFRLRQGLDHVVTPVTSAVARTAFAGWFQSDGSSLVSTLTAGAADAATAGTA
jgi:hypothetical protein